MNDVVLCSRQEARSFGMVRYYTGNPCRNGHSASRLTSNGNCIECMAISNQRWKSGNPEKSVATQKRSIAKNIDKIREKQRIRQKRWVDSDPQRARDVKRRYYLKDIQKSRANGRLKRGLPVPTRECPQLCEACGIKEAITLDHCHKTGAFRGWLCRTCNSALGMAGDTAESVSKLLDYLKRSN